MFGQRLASIQPINARDGLAWYTAEDIAHDIELVDAAAKPVRVRLARWPGHSPPALSRLRGRQCECGGVLRNSTNTGSDDFANCTHATVGIAIAPMATPCHAISNRYCDPGIPVPNHLVGCELNLN